MTLNSNETERIMNNAAGLALGGQPDNTNNLNYDYNSAHVAARVDPDRKWLPEEGERILESYLENINDTMTSAVAHMIERAYQSGLSVDEIIMAIEETAFAPHPSPRYLRAVLKSWIETGFTVSKIRHFSSQNDSRIAWWKK